MSYTAKKFMSSGLEEYVEIKLEPKLINIDVLYSFVSQLLRLTQ